MLRRRSVVRAGYVLAPLAWATGYRLTAVRLLAATGRCLSPAGLSLPPVLCAVTHEPTLAQDYVTLHIILP